MRAKSGAATSPPSLAGPLGVSRETSTTRAGRDAGTKPTKDATWSTIEYLPPGSTFWAVPVLPATA